MQVIAPVIMKRVVVSAKFNVSIFPEAFDSQKKVQSCSE
jgi:hypothetical protein